MYKNPLAIVTSCFKWLYILLKSPKSHERVSNLGFQIINHIHGQFFFSKPNLKIKKGNSKTLFFCWISGSSFLFFPLTFLPFKLPVFPFGEYLEIVKRKKKVSEKWKKKQEKHNIFLPCFFIFFCTLMKSCPYSQRKMYPRYKKHVEDWFRKKKRRVYTGKRFGSNRQQPEENIIKISTTNERVSVIFRGEYHSAQTR